MLIVFLKFLFAFFVGSVVEDLFIMINYCRGVFFKPLSFNEFIYFVFRRFDRRFLLCVLMKIVFIILIWVVCFLLLI